ncbi:MAG: PqqD family protein [Candidatus Dormibacteria bacterium]
MLCYRRADGVLHEVVDSKVVLVHPDGKELLTLNPVGTLVWEAMDGPSDAAGLTDKLLPRLGGVPRHQVLADISAFLTELTGLGLAVQSSSSG